MVALIDVGSRIVEYLHVLNFDFFFPHDLIDL